MVLGVLARSGRPLRPALLTAPPPEISRYDRVWLKVRASSLRLRDEAVRIKMSLLLEPTKLAAAAGKGKRNKTDDGWLWRPLKLEDSDENRKAGLYFAPKQSMVKVSFICFRFVSNVFFDVMHFGFGQLGFCVQSWNASS